MSQGSNLDSLLVASHHIEKFENDGLVSSVHHYYHHLLLWCQEGNCLQTRPNHCIVHPHRATGNKLTARKEFNSALL